MTEPNGNDTANTKKSVVDDFFSALFANNTAASSTPANNSEAYEHKDRQASNQEYKAEIQDYKYSYTADANIKNNNNDDDEQQDNFNNASEEGRAGARKRERVLDEFDEYSLLSKRRGSDNRNKINVNNRRKSTEAREIQDNSNEIDNVKLDRQILSKRDIDWSTVKPESRMLVRQLPKFIDKQDVMNHFSKYGEVLEVVQKTPFGFVHFENPEACAQAVQIENGKPFHGIVLDLEICKRKPFFARAAEREMRELANREGNNNNNNADERNVAPVTRRNSQQRNFEPRARGNIRPDQYDPYENSRNISPPRYQQQAPPPPTPPRRGRNNDRNNDYRPDYGRNNNDYPSYSTTNNNNNNGRNQDYNNRQQDNSRSYRPAPYRYNNNNNNNTEPVNDVRPYNGRYNEPVNSYTPRYNNNNNNNNDDRSYPRYNEAAESRNAYNRYNDSSRYHDTPARSPVARNYTAVNPSLPPASPLIPSRQGNDVPVVQIVAWDNVAYGFTDYIERVFSSNQIRASSITLPFSKSAREEIVKQMILEGVKAIIMIDRDNEAQSKIYLQVFAPAEHGQGVRYDEYDSVTAIEAVSIIRRSYPVPVAQPPVAAPPAIDMNTLASLYNMIQPKPSGSVVSPPVTNQPTIPQLLATLVNGLNVSSPQPPQPLQPEQPNIAALISTAANGNPALAQLLAQMTSNSSMSYSPSMPHVEPTLGYPSTEQQQK